MKTQAILFLTLLLHASQCLEKKDIQDMVLKVFGDCTLKMSGQNFNKEPSGSPWIRFPFVKEVMGQITEEDKKSAQSKYEAYYFTDLTGIQEETDQSQTKQEPLTLFRILFIEKEVKENPDVPSKDKNKKQKKLTVDMTNGIVTSRIKIDYGVGGLSLIETVVKNAVIKFLLKVDQSVPRIGLVQDQIATGISKILDDLQKLLVDRVSDIKLKTTQSIGPLSLESIDSSNSLNEEKLNALNESFRKPVFLYLNSFKSNKIHSDKSFELICYEIEVKPVQQETSTTDFGEFLDSLSVIIIDIQGRISVHLVSNYFQISQEIAVQTKLSILGVVENMLIKIFTHILPNFIALDSSNIDQSFNPDALFEEYQKTFGWQQASNQNTKSSVIVKKFGNFEIKISWRLDNVSVNDMTIDVNLHQSEVFIEKESITVPIHSQYNITPIVTGFVENVLNQYYHVIYSAFNRKASQLEQSTFDFQQQKLKIPEEKNPTQSGDQQTTLKSVQKADILKLERLLLGTRVRPFAELPENLKLQLELANNGPTTDSQNVYFVINRNPETVEQAVLKEKEKSKWLRGNQVRVELKTLLAQTTKVSKTSGNNSDGKLAQIEPTAFDERPNLNTRAYIEYVFVKSV